MIKTSIISGIFATAIFSILIALMPHIGISRLPVWVTLARAVHGPVVLGWGLHFLIGIFFAYIFLLARRKFRNSIFTFGFVFGIIIFIPSAFFIFSSDFDSLFFLASLVGHIVFGLALSFCYFISPNRGL